jgi:hypothetical protein
VTANFNCDFKAPFNMILTKIKFTGQQNVASGTAFSWGANIRIFVNGRPKRFRPDAPLADSWDIWALLGAGSFSTRELSIRPLVIPAGTNVTIQMNMDLESAFGESWVRVGEFFVGYRVPLSRLDHDFNFGGGTKSWVGSRKEMLPVDLMRLGVQGVDAEGSVVGNNYQLDGWHGENEEVTMGRVSLASVAAFPIFQVLGIPGVEKLRYDSLDGDGDNWLGLNRLYEDDADSDPDSASRNKFFIDPIRNTFTVQKRTPVIGFNGLPSKLKLGDLIGFGGNVSDPYQPGMRDFIAGLPVNLLRNDASLQLGTVAADGTFLVDRTLIGEDAGVDRRWQITSANTYQYDAAASSSQTRTVWEIISTLLGLRLGKDPPYWMGNKLKLIAKLTRKDNGQNLQGLTVGISDDTGSRSGPTDVNGEFTFEKLLNAELSILVQAGFGGASTNYQEYLASISSPEQLIIGKYSVNTLLQVIANLPFDVSPDIFFQGRAIPFTATLKRADLDVDLNLPVSLDLDATAIAVGPAPLHHSYAVGDEAAHNVNAHFAGYSDLTGDPWIFYNRSEDTFSFKTQLATIRTILTLGLRPDFEGKNIYKGDLIEFIAKLSNADSFAPLSNMSVKVSGGLPPASEQQNQFQAYGDFDKSGLIDVADQVAIVNHYGSRQGQPGWDPLYDLNSDGVVDLRDLALWGSRYGIAIHEFLGSGLVSSGKTTTDGIFRTGSLGADNIGLNSIHGYFMALLDATRTVFPYDVQFTQSEATLDLNILERLTSGLTLRILLNNLPISDTDPDLNVTFTVKDATTNAVVGTATQQNAFVELNPATYPHSYRIECAASYKSIQYAFQSKTQSLSAAGDTPIVTFNIETTTIKNGETGRIHIVINVPPSAIAGSTVTISGTTTYLFRAAGNRPMRIPFCTVTVYVNDKETVKARSNFKGEFAVDWKPPSAGAYDIYASVVRPFRGQVARSAAETITVISS